MYYSCHLYHSIASASLLPVLTEEKIKWGLKVLYLLPKGLYVHRRELQDWVSPFSQDGPGLNTAIRTSMVHNIWLKCSYMQLGLDGRMTISSFLILHLSNLLLKEMWILLLN